MEAATYPTLLRLCIPPAGANSDGSHASWKLARVQEVSSSLGRLTTGDGSRVSGGATVRAHRGAVGGACGAVPFLQKGGPDGGLVAAVEPVDSEVEEAEEEDIGNQNIILQYFQ
ncbi:hypothetical protein NDU88_003623 [Pleurodeles waltl]|uniref:Uncharacterized protein n=1 Tax=Pleurodeles waltl TaxID=8319 RepID=A0AAV7T6B6_PLEWA|nr:hypothetical protein NDU88_003623 [Pleurodeles waltl]